MGRALTLFLVIRLGRPLALGLLGLLASLLVLGAAPRASAQGSNLPPPPPPPPGQGPPPATEPPPPATGTAGAPAGGTAGTSRRDRRADTPPPRSEEPPRRRERVERTDEGRGRDEGGDFGGGPPAAHTGFQIAVRTGFSIPYGTAVNDVELGDNYGVQVPVMADIGAKITPHVFLGGYLGAAFGGVAGGQARACERQGPGRGGVSCSALRAMFGFEFQYHVLPDRKVNPWFGAGVGWEILQLSYGGTTTAVSGFEFLRPMGGVDFRLSRVVGVGPFADFTLARYVTSSGTIDSAGMHGWFTLGARVVFFP